MQTVERREKIKQLIRESETPISATTLAKQCHVSRQIVVGDVALLRAAQENIIATPRGYLYQKEESKNRYVVACMHDAQNTQEELNIIVDCGAEVENVIVSHPIYGELVGALHIQNRLDVQQFIERCKDSQAQNLSSISNGMHLHTIVCKDETQYETIVDKLKQAGYLYEK